MEHETEFEAELKKRLGEGREKLNQAIARKTVFGSSLTTEAALKLDAKIKRLRKETTAMSKALTAYKKYSK